MVKILQGTLTGKGKKIAIVASRFNDFITQRLLRECVKELKVCGVKDKDITVAWVTGSFEIPVAALKLASRKTMDAVICLGCIIKGETIHFDLVAYAAARGIEQAAIQTGKPIIFGVLATDTVNQAYKRSQPKGDNKGRDAARSAIEMANLIPRI